MLSNGGKSLISPNSGNCIANSKGVPFVRYADDSMIFCKSKRAAKLKELTSRSNGWGYAKRKQKLEEYIKGWVGYYHLANMKRFLIETDEWLRRRLRMCIWKSWKRVKTRVANLVKCGIDKNQACMWGNSRLGHWRIAGSYILSRAITNEKLSMAGYATLMGSYIEWHPK